MKILRAIDLLRGLSSVSEVSTNLQHPFKYRNHAFTALSP